MTQRIQQFVSVAIVLLLAACATGGLETAPTFTAATAIESAPTSAAAGPPAPTNTEALPPTQTAALLPTETLPPVEENASGKAAGIILFIGDGMGPNQRLAAQWYAHGMDGQLNMDIFPVHGLSQTAAANSPITDSAAGGTALASGHKTGNGIIGMDVDYNPLPTILEQAQAEGWSVGLITTVQMAHATPAVFAAHTESRENYLTIALQEFDHGIDVLLGGGEDDFIPSSEKGCYPDLGHRWDGRDLIQEMVGMGYTYVCTAEQFIAVDPATTDKLVGFFGDDEIVFPSDVTLAMMTKMALDILSKNPNGFFLMVEGGQIDWFAHDNDAQNTIATTLELDAAVTEADLFAIDHPDTLIIVTADHETGGMSLNLDGSGQIFRQDGPFTMVDGTEFWVDWETTGHSPVDVPVTAQGPWSELLVGEYPNTWIYWVMYAALTGELPGGN